MEIYLKCIHVGLDTKDFFTKDEKYKLKFPGKISSLEDFSEIKAAVDNGTINDDSGMFWYTGYNPDISGGNVGNFVLAIESKFEIEVEDAE